MSQSCHTWVMSHMSHVTHESCHFRKGSLLILGVKWMTVTRMNQSVLSHVWMSHVTWEGVMSHVWTSHVTRMHKSCHTYEWVMSHIWMSHVAHMNESCRTYEWVMSHICISHVTHMNESYHTYEWVMSHIWMSHITWEGVLSLDPIVKWVDSHVDESCKCHELNHCRQWTTLDESCTYHLMSHVYIYICGGVG